MVTVDFCSYFAGIFKFLFNALKAKKGAISQELCHSLEFRLHQRRNVGIVSLLKYLQNKDLSGTSELPVATKKACISLLTNLFIQHFADDFDDHDGVENCGRSTDAVAVDADAVDIDGETERSYSGNFDDLSKQLNEAIQKETAPSSSSNMTSKREGMIKIIKHETTGFDRTSVLGENMNKVLSALKTIQSTSTESERVFSLAANIVTKRRSRLEDKSLNNICFLRSYFMRKKRQAA